MQDWTTWYLMISDKVMGLKKLKQKCACRSSFVKIIWRLLSLKMSTTLRIRSSGNTFCRYYQRTKGCRSWEELVEVRVCSFNTLYCFQFALNHKFRQLCFLYMLKYPVMYLQSDRENGSKHARNCVYLSKIGIVPTIKNLICRCLLYDCGM